MTVKYAAGEKAEEPAKAFVSLNWVLSDEPMSLETELALDFLDALMLGTAAAPLRKALNDSGLGEAIIGGGLQGELCQMGFSLGLKGVDPANADKVSQKGCRFGLMQTSQPFQGMQSMNDDTVHVPCYC